MADKTLFLSPSKPDLSETAPLLRHRRAALDTLRDRSPGPAGQVDTAQLALIAGTVCVTAIGAAWAQGLSLSPVVAGAGSGLALGLGATRLGVMARRIGLRTRRSVVPGAMAGIGAGILVALGLTVLPLIATTGLAALAAVHAWRTQRDLISENLLAREIAAAREDLDRDSAAFADNLREMQASTQAEVTQLCRKAGIDPKLLDPVPDEAK
ncbi:hypothetical protein [Puniceibacterium sediminis]|uniref:Uncharacterized protein n=1 Tax=Puniceibacterium sediminis TaxID=1608407 RepID=A0A238WDH8_9RHOB|nr:hypothetical protein [Puniceibacterium sediminis]SNR44646.1 hypothetical protein SAMN06265370_105134 [Puniceibacterium sediminis]